MKSLRQILTLVALTMITAVLVGATAHAGGVEKAAADEQSLIGVYDEAAYTAYVETTMKKLDKLYLQFCNKCDTDPVAAGHARQEFLTTVHDLMQYMNARFDKLDPKKGAALSQTETLVSIHAMTMLIDMMTATELQELTAQAQLP